ncbi:MAG: ribosome silencing factor [Acidobacteria bacterium]|nr:ribosome silencing factor [Acidobacteriota bacterium]MBI3262659.1 ribosome silencing factor [Acidobacteriota bacterium]
MTHSTREKPVPASDSAVPGPLGRAIEAARDKKAVDLVALDLRSIEAFTDFFFICSGQNPRQIKAIADAIEEALERSGIRPSHVEGYDRAEWILIDCFDFVFHVFTPDTRRFYDLERLWGSAARLDLPDVPPRAP